MSEIILNGEVVGIASEECVNAIGKCIEKYEQRIAELKVENETLLKAHDIQLANYRAAKQRIAQLEALCKTQTDLLSYARSENKILQEFVDECVVLTGSLWPQNNTTKMLNRLLDELQRVEQGDKSDE